MIKKLISSLIIGSFLLGGVSVASAASVVNQQTYDSALQQLINLLLQEISNLEQELAHQQSEINSLSVNTSTATSTTSTQGVPIYGSNGVILGYTGSSNQIGSASSPATSSPTLQQIQQSPIVTPPPTLTASLNPQYSSFNFGQILPSLITVSTSTVFGKLTTYYHFPSCGGIEGSIDYKCYVGPYQIASFVVTISGDTSQIVGLKEATFSYIQPVAYSFSKVENYTAQSIFNGQFVQTNNAQLIPPTNNQWIIDVYGYTESFGQDRLTSVSSTPLVAINNVYVLLKDGSVINLSNPEFRGQVNQIY